MSNIQQDIEEFGVLKDQIGQIVNGDENTEVDTASGLQPSLRKVVADAEADARAQVNISTNAAAGHASNASGSEEAAGQHAVDAGQSKVAAQEAKTGALAAESGAGVSAGAAKDDADRAEQAEAEALQHKIAAESAENTATQKAAAASQSEQNAAAVVTGGTATFDPEAGKMPIADSKGLIDNGWILAVPSRAEFEARQEINRQMYSGSGFVEMGRSYSGDSGLVPVPGNYGISSYIGSENKIRLGYRETGASSVGDSKTGAPYVNVDGVLLAIRGCANAFDNSVAPGESQISLPDAPLATNKVLNGGFDVDATGWEPTPHCDLDVSGGKVTATVLEGGSIWNEYFKQTVTGLTAGKEYLLGYGYEGGSTRARASVPVANINTYSTSATHIKFTATAEQMDIRFYIDGDVGSSIIVDDVFVIDLSEVNRTDLVALEVWHEKISDKGSVCPFGNGQYGANSWEGISLDDTLIAQGYSAFGDWDDDTKCYAARWSELSAAQKQTFVSEPLNNIYNDGGELIQVRYRVRVLKGMGDSWEFKTYGFRSISDYRVRAQGIASAYPGEGAANVNTYRTTADRIANDGAAGSLGVYSPLLTSNAHNGLCFAVPIALVSRRNQGAYHPTFNPNGTRGFANPTGGARRGFYESGIRLQPRSLMDCFTFASTGVYPFVDGIVYGHVGSNEGNIASGGSVRPDGKRYDAVYAGDVQDLRNNVKKVTDLGRCLSREFQRAVAGELRGTEKALVTKVLPHGSNSKVGEVQFNTTYSMRILVAGLELNNGGVKLAPGVSTINVINEATGAWGVFRCEMQSSGIYRFGTDPIAGTMVREADFPSDGSQNANLRLILPAATGVLSSGEVLCCDIIGDPANYFRGHYTHKSNAGEQTVNTGDVVLAVEGAIGGGTSGHFYERIGSSNTFLLSDRDYSASGSWKDLGTDRAGSWVKEGVFGTPLLVHPDTGASLIPDGATKEFKVSRKVQSVESVLYSVNGGKTWTDTIGTWKDALEGAANAREFGMAPNYTYMVFYTTKANGWEAAGNAEVLALGDVLGGDRADVNRGGALISEMIGKVCDTTAGGHPQTVPLSRSFVAPYLGNELYGWSAQPPEHEPILLLTADDVPAAKVLPYLTRENGRLYLQALFKEMKYDVDWGDDSRFNVIDGVSTVTDDNGNSVLVGQKRIALPYFIEDGE